MNHRFHAGKRQEGFTLIEVMIALAVLTIGILTVMAMQVRSIGGNADAMHRTQALTIGQDAIERIMGSPYAALTVGTTSATVDQYTVTQVIANPPSGSTLANARYVTVTVTWQEGSVAKSIPLTMIASQSMENSYF